MKLITVVPQPVVNTDVARDWKQTDRGFTDYGLREFIPPAGYESIIHNTRLCWRRKEETPA